MTFNNVVPGNNWNYTYSDYTPFIQNIIGITNAQFAVVTFGTQHPYTTGEIVSFRVSQPYGMIELNNQQAKVLAITTFTITVNINTLNLNTFIYPPIGEVVMPALCVPVGSGVIPGSFPATVNLQDNFDNQPLN